MNKPTTHSSTPGSLFGLTGDEPGKVHVELDGEPVVARAADTVASLLLRHTDPAAYRRSTVTGTPRAPLCMMGVCFECLVEIDGQKNQQGCLVRVRNGMRIRRQLNEGPQS